MKPFNLTACFITKRDVKCYDCFDVKPFNLTACFITKRDVKCYDSLHQNGGLRTAVYNNVQALVMLFLAYNVNIDWREKFYMQ